MVNTYPFIHILHVWTSDVGGEDKHADERCLKSPSSSLVRSVMENATGAQKSPTVPAVVGVDGNDKQAISAAVHVVDEEGRAGTKAGEGVFYKYAALCFEPLHTEGLSVLGVVRSVRKNGRRLSFVDLETKYGLQQCLISGDILGMPAGEKLVLRLGDKLQVEGSWQEGVRDRPPRLRVTQMEVQHRPRHEHQHMLNEHLARSFVAGPPRQECSMAGPPSPVKHGKAPPWSHPEGGSPACLSAGTSEPIRGGVACMGAPSGTSLPLSWSRRFIRTRAPTLILS